MQVAARAGRLAMEKYAAAERKVADVRQRWRIRRDELDQRQQPNDMRRSRMSCADSLKEPYRKSQDWTGQMGMSPSGRFQVVEDSRKREPLMTRDGLQWRFGWALLITMAVILTIILAADAVSIGWSGRNIERYSSRIAVFAEKNGELTNQLNYSAADISVCTEAVKLNLISANGATTVRLTAPQGANMTFTAAAGNGAGHAPGELLASAVGD